MSEPVDLIPGATRLRALERIYRSDAGVRLDPACRVAVEASAAAVERAARSDQPIYGVNTGFGKLASVSIPPEQTRDLQRNLVRSHCSGVGEPLPPAIVRLVLTLKLLSLGRGASGVRWQVLALIENLLNRNVLPVIPSQGSVGASGDLAPLAHMSAVLMGEGRATFDGRDLPGGEALNAAGLEPVTLEAKEGLGLINGTQVSTALALAGLFESWRLANAGLLISALSTDAVMGSTAPLLPDLHELRGHPGQIDAAKVIDGLLDGSEIRVSHIEGDERVQDPYCIRCQPQVVGAAIDLLRQTARTLRIEANAATDNPLVVGEQLTIASGGNFHAEPVAFAADIMALAICEIGAIAQRRVALMVDPALSYGLPAFLTPEPGLNSGFMVAEITTAALMSENKQRAAPCSVDSTPTSANQEDHVSMACHGARRLMPMVGNLARILAVELMAAAQGVEFRAPLKTSPLLQQAVGRLRDRVATLTDDRDLSGDIETVAALLRDGTFSDDLPPHLSFTWAHD